MKKGKAAGVGILAAWILVHSFLLYGYASKWEKLFNPEQWETFMYPDVMTIKYPRGWRVLPGELFAGGHGQRLGHFSFSASPFEQVFFKTDYSTLDETYNRAISDLRRKFKTLKTESDPVSRVIDGRQMLMGTFQSEIFRPFGMSIHVSGYIVSFNARSGYYERTYCFIATSREKYGRDMKKIFEEMILTSKVDEYGRR